MKKRRVNFQKLFSFASFIFLLTCTLWYGGRFIYYYLENNKTTKKNEVSITQKLMNSKNKLNKINNEYYFYQDTKNNYVTYSNLTFRILKITEDKKIVLISDDAITNLAYGEEVKFDKSPIINWLNKNTNSTNSGILENNLNNVDKYLDETTSCIDDIKDVKDLTCNTKSNNKISILTVNDYINSGGDKSFINNNKYTYLANQNESNEKWIINDNGKLTTDDGSGIYGIKIVITLKESTKITSGNGTKEKPYKFESKDKHYFGSYIKLDNDIWRVYEDEGDTLKLSLNDYLKVNNEKIEHIYSNSNSFHNDTINGSLAYYLNTTYYNSLKYNDLIKVNNYSNGYYDEENDYDYTTAIKNKADTKVSNLSIGDAIINNSLHNYFLATGTYNKSNYIYLVTNNNNLDTIKVSNEANVVPCITIDKNKLTSGKGTKEDPYRTE